MSVPPTCPTWGWSAAASVSVPSPCPEPLDRAPRRPPTGVEIVLEVVDVEAERDRVRRAGWPITEDIASRPWGLRDFRLLDPSGYYVRLTGR